MGKPEKAVIITEAQLTQLMLGLQWLLGYYEGRAGKGVPKSIADALNRGLENTEAFIVKEGED